MKKFFLGFYHFCGIAGHFDHRRHLALNSLIFPIYNAFWNSGSVRCWAILASNPGGRQCHRNRQLQHRRNGIVHTFGKERLKLLTQPAPWRSGCGHAGKLPLAPETNDGMADFAPSTSV